MTRWRVHGERAIYTSDRLNVRLADVELPDGTRFDHHVVRLPRPSVGVIVCDAERGVLLLNRVLTVQPRQPASHRGKGWEAVTEQAIHALVARGGPLAAILWGRDAQGLKPMLGGVPWVESVHPSPLSAHRGFFGSKPFSRVNRMLTDQGGTPVDWRLSRPA